MGKAFFIFDPNTSDAQERDDKIIPDPVTLGVTEMILDGKLETITATSGQIQYVIVDPGEYPSDEDERHARKGSTR